MSIPLVIRKNIRDNEVHLKESLEKIRNAVGKEFEFETDWGAVVAQLDQNTKDRIGQLYQKECFEYLANNIEKLCKVETSKEAFYEATTANKIIFRVNDKAKDYWVLLFENGALVVEHKKNICNTYTLGSFDLISIIPTPGLPLVTRLNLEKNRPNLEENLEKINALTGASDWVLEVDFDKVLPQLEERIRNTIGDLYYREVLEYLVRNLEKTLKTETTKEAFNEATNQHKITISINDKQPTYWAFKFKDGGLDITHKKSICNTYEVGSISLEELIPSPGLPLVSRLNIEKNKENLERFLEQINTATGQSDWTVEVEFEKIISTLEPRNQPTIGDLYHREALEYIARNITNICKKETVKEAFNEATSQRKIIFRGVVDDKKINGYWAIKFEDGAVAITHRKSICNIYELGSLDLEAIIPSPGLPLVTRLDIEKHRENLETHLEEIRTITGESDWTVEIDFEKALAACPNQNRNIGNLYYNEVLTYLVNNLKKTLAKETTKEAFLEATNQRKIEIRVSTNAKETKYWNLFFENGALIIVHKKDICNVYEVGSFDLVAVMPVPGILSLVARLNIQDSQEKLAEHLEEIKQATGEEYTVDDSCFEAVYKALPEGRQRENIGRTFLDEALGYLARNFKKALADDMVKEAFNETATAHQITFRPDSKAQKYWNLKFENGIVVITFKPDICNIYELGSIDIEKLL